MRALRSDCPMSSRVASSLLPYSSPSRSSLLTNVYNMSTASETGDHAFQRFLDEGQYTRRAILAYQQVFGKTFVSTGGSDTTERFCKEYLHLKPDQYVLDIGCGTGGSALFMARHYGAHVHGVDLSQNMIALAKEYRSEAEAGVKHRVQFHVDDATTMKFPRDFYDVVYSRDTILHIQDKEALFRKLYSTLKPGGLVFITDYCRGDQKHSREFANYVIKRGYHLLTVDAYGARLERAGFGEVEAFDATQDFLSILRSELASYVSRRADVLEDGNTSEEDFARIAKDWREKAERCDAGDHVWGCFVARKLFH